MKRLLDWFKRQVGHDHARADAAAFMAKREAYLRGEITEAEFCRGWQLVCKPNCKRCHGRGYTGVDRATGAGVPCPKAKVVNGNMCVSC